MNIKSLLIGSAAALVAVTGARAADAVVVPEPEPVEYVRVCDMYGAGFFYIPGTETCLRISGKVWWQVAASSERPGDTAAYHGFWGVDHRNWASNVEADVNFDARAETEWGTLQSYIRVRSGWDSQNQVAAVNDYAGTMIGAANFAGDGVARLDQAWFSIGGLLMGYTESAWSATKNGGPSSWGSFTSWGGLYYNYQQRQVVQYNFGGGNGFFGTISIEDDGNRNFAPDAVAVIGVAQGWGGVWAKVAFDEDTGGANPFWGARANTMSGVSGWAAQLGASFNFANSPGTAIKVVGYYSNNANAYTVGGRWSVLAALTHNFTPAFRATIGAQYIGDTNWGAAGNPSLWAAELGLYWTPVENLEFSTEINYDKASGADGTVSGFFRVTRSF